MFGTQTRNESVAATPAAVFSNGIVGDEIVGDALATIDVGDVRTSEDADVGVGKFGANGAQGRKGNDGVAYPVGGAN